VIERLRADYADATVFLWFQCSSATGVPGAAKRRLSPAWGEAGAGVSRKIVAWPSGSSRQSWVTRLAGARTNSAGQWRRVEAAGLGEPVQILALLALTVIEFAVKVTTLRRNSSALLLDAQGHGHSSN
jgi:hypothetical protein